MRSTRSLRQQFMRMFVGRRELERYRLEAAEASVALARGEHARATSILRHWTSDATRADVAADASRTLGWIALRSGSPQEAVDILLDTDARNPRIYHANNAGAFIAAERALGYALLGDAAKAGETLSLAERRSKETVRPLEMQAMKDLARAVVDCRAERSTIAAAMLDEQWKVYEASLPGRTTRLIRIVRAFAHAATGARNAGAADIMLMGLRPSHPGEFEFLGVAWPEMRAFLVTHDLV